MAISRSTMQAIRLFLILQTALFIVWAAATERDILGGPYGPQRPCEREAILCIYRSYNPRVGHIFLREHLDFWWSVLVANSVGVSRPEGCRCRSGRELSDGLSFVYTTSLQQSSSVAFNHTQFAASCRRIINGEVLVCSPQPGSPPTQGPSRPRMCLAPLRKKLRPK